MKNSQINFYNELLIEIKEEIKKSNLSEALILIIEELKMPYVPMRVEQELLDLKKNIEISIFNINENNLSIEKIINLLQNNKINLYDKYEIVNLLDKYNLKNEFVNELLINDNVDFLLKLKILSKLKEQTSFSGVEVTLNKEIFKVSDEQLFDINTNSNFSADSRKIEEYLFKQPVILEQALVILEKYYFREYFFDKEIRKIWKEILFIVGKIFEEKNLQSQILSLNLGDFKEFEKKILKILNFTKY